MAAMLGVALGVGACSKADGQGPQAAANLQNACQSTVQAYVGDQLGPAETMPTAWLIDQEEPAVDGSIAVWTRIEQNQEGRLPERPFRQIFNRCLNQALQQVAADGGQPCALRWAHTDDQGKADATGFHDVRLMHLLNGQPVTRRGVEAQAGDRGLLRLVDPDTGISYWFGRAQVLAVLRNENLCRPAQVAEQPPQRQPQQPTGGLNLQCQLQSGQAYQIVVDERRSTVSARDSAGGEWIQFQNGARHPGEINYVDMVEVTPDLIRFARTIEETGRTSDPNITNNPESNELAGVLMDLGAFFVSGTMVAIDRNSGVIQTGGYAGPFPNRGLGMCEPWTGPRF